MNEGRRIVFDEEGFIAEGEDVARDIASKSSNYSETVEVVNMPAELRERLKENRVSFDQTAGSGYVTKIYEALSREFSAQRLDVPSLFIAAAGVKGTIEPHGGWENEWFVQKMNQHFVNLVALWTKATGLNAKGEFERVPVVPLGMRLRSEPLDGASSDAATRYMEIIAKELKPLAGMERYIVLDEIMSVMANRMGFGREFRVEVERWLGEVAKPKPTGLVGFFGLE